MADRFDLVRLQNAAVLASAILTEFESTMLEMNRRCRTDYEMEVENILLLEQNLQDLLAGIEELTNPITVGGRRRRIPVNLIDHETVTSLQTQGEEVQVMLDETTAMKGEKKNLLTKAKAASEKWNLKFPARSVDELVAHGNRIIQPAIDYFDKQFNKENGDLYHVCTSLSIS